MHVHSTRSLECRLPSSLTDRGLISFCRKRLSYIRALCVATSHTRQYGRSSVFFESSFFLSSTMELGNLLFSKPPDLLHSLYALSVPTDVCMDLNYPSHDCEDCLSYAVRSEACLRWCRHSSSFLHRAFPSLSRQKERKREVFSKSLAFFLAYFSLLFFR